MSKRIEFLMLVALVGSGLMLTPAARAQTTWYVDDDAPNDPGPGDPTVSDPLEDGSPEHPFDAIQKGIDAAQDGDTVLVLDGTYTGPGNRDLDFGGKAIMVRSENGPEGCIIDCEASEWAFWFHNGETADAVVDGFTIRNGGAEFGPGVDCRFSSPTITNCTFQNNSAAYGGAMYNHGSSPTVANCTFENNLAYCGGAMDNSSSSPTVSNCTFTNNSATYPGGGMLNRYSSNPIVTNCIFWGDSPDEIFGPAVVTYSDVQGGWDGEGNTDADPLFVDPDGPDDDPNTWEDNDYRLSAGSPCIDAADNEAVPPDGLDLDEDGDTDEPMPFDLDGKPRFVDDPDTDDTGNPHPGYPDLPIVDMGAYEFQACPGDLDGDGDTDQSDLGILLADWGCTSDCIGDLDGDGDTDQADLGILLADWGCGAP